MQNVIFFAVLKNGETVYELERDNKENLFVDLPFGEIEKLGLMNYWFSLPIFKVYFNISDGIFFYETNSEKFQSKVSYKGEELVNKVEKYPMIQLKEAYAEFFPGGGNGATLISKISAHVIGWRIPFKDNDFQALVKVKPETMVPEVSLTIFNFNDYGLYDENGKFIPAQPLDNVQIGWEKV